MDSATTFGTRHQASLTHAHHRGSKVSIEYRVIWSLVFLSSLVGGVVVRLLVRPLAVLVRAALGEDGRVAVRRRDATLLGEARAAADAAAPFVFQVS